MDRGAWWAPVHGVANLDMTEQRTLTHSGRREQRRFREMTEASVAGGA